VSVELNRDRPWSSLHHLNFSMEAVKKSGQFVSLGFSEDEHVSLTDFLNMFTNTILSMPDKDNTEQQKLLLKNIVQLFPKNKSKEADYKRVSELFTRLSSGRQAKEQRQVEQKTADFTVAIEQLFSEAQAAVCKPVGERLNKLLPSSLNPNAQAERLSLAASMILFEDQLFRHIHTEHHLNLHLDDLTNFVCTGDSSKIQVGGGTHTMVKIVSEEQLEKSPSLFAFMMMISHTKFDVVAKRLLQRKPGSMLEVHKIRETFDKALATGIPLAEKWEIVVKKVKATLQKEIAQAYWIEHVGALAEKTIAKMDGSQTFVRMSNDHSGVKYLAAPLIETFSDAIAKLHQQFNGNEISSQEMRKRQKKLFARALGSYLEHRKEQESFYKAIFGSLSNTKISTLKRVQLGNYLYPDAPPDLKKLPTALPFFDFTPVNCPVMIDNCFTAIEQQGKIPDSKEEPLSIFIPKPQKPKKAKKKAPSSFAMPDKPLIPETDSKENEMPAALFTFSPFSYAQRANRWLTAPVGKPLDEIVFWEYAGQSLDAHQKALLDHGFSPIVDHYVHLGLEEPWENPTTKHLDKRYVVPMEIETEDGYKIRGMATLCIGKDNKLYHRYFVPMSSEKLIEKFGSRTFYHVDFPGLDEAAKDIAHMDAAVKKHACEDTAKEDPLFGMIYIQDRRLNVKITLFRTES